MPTKRRAPRPTPVLHANLPLVEVGEPWLLDAILCAIPDVVVAHRRRNNEPSAPQGRRPPWPRGQ
ncbi:MAG TPA: hypothetical protein VF897_20715 [Roseiflexaceae bacterium]